MNIIEKSKKLLGLLKSGTGIRSTLGECYFDEETRKLLDIVINECKSTIWRKKDGKIIRYESDLDIQTVKDVVDLFASDKTYIPKGITSTILSSKLVLGPIIRIPYSKKQDGTVQIDSVFGVSTLELLGNSEEKRERFVEDILEPIIEESVNEDKTLKNKHRIGRIMNKLLNIKRDNRTTLEKCEDFLKEETKVKEEDIKAVAAYLINSVRSNFFMQEIIEDEKSGNSIIIPGDERKGYSKMIYGMAVNAYEKLYVDINEICESRIQDIRQIYSNLIAQVEAESIDLKGKTPDEIEKSIKQINYLTINQDKKSLIGENGYRNVNVGISNQKFKLQSKELVEPSMKNLVESMKKLVDSKDSMTKEEYILETVRLHYRFIKIHPFPDGNGRTGRAISNMLLAQIGEAAVFEKENKAEYIRGTNILHFKMQRENEEQDYFKSLATGTDYCKQIEDRYLYLLEEYIGMKCIETPIEYNRDITAILSPIQREEGSR